MPFACALSLWYNDRMEGRKMKPTTVRTLAQAVGRSSFAPGPKRRSMLCAVLFLIGMLLSAPGHALTQRGINELAASLLRTHRLIVEEPGLRLPQEALPAYFQRLLSAQPGEKTAARKARIEVYLNSMHQSTESSSDARKTPSLHNVSPANRELWTQITQYLSDLPGDLRKAIATWRREAAGSSGLKESSEAFARFFWHVQNAYAALRDALP